MTTQNKGYKESITKVKKLYKFTVFRHGYKRSNSDKVHGIIKTEDPPSYLITDSHPRPQSGELKLRTKMTNDTQKPVNEL